MQTPYLRCGAIISILACQACPGDTGFDPTDDPTTRADATPPSVTVVSPTPGENVGATILLNVSGTARDNQGVTEVRVSVGGAAPVLATGTTSWSAQVPVAQAGPVSVTAIARDAAGNTSSPMTVDLSVSPGWAMMGTVTPNVRHIAIASDGQRLFRFPCLSGGFIDDGTVSEWDGAAWVTAAAVTNQCHNPSLAVRGNEWIGSFTDDGQHVGFAGHTNGSTGVSGPPTRLRDQYGTDVAFAQGQGYLSFASRYSDGGIFSYLMLHIDRRMGQGQASELAGGWGAGGQFDIGIETAITGDDNGYYVAYPQGNGLYVRYGGVVGGKAQQHTVGGSLFTGAAAKPDIVSHLGTPIVAWIDGSDNRTAFVSGWDGNAWVNLGSTQVNASSFIGAIKLVSDDTDMYVLVMMSSSNPVGSQLGISQWTGGGWTPIVSPLTPGELADATQIDVTIYDGTPVVAYLANGLRIKRYLN